MPERLATGSRGTSSPIIEVSKYYTASFGDSSPTIIWNIPFNRRLVRISIEVSEEWNGIGAKINLGSSILPTKYFNETELDLLSLGFYDKEFSEEGPNNVLLTIVPGASASTGIINIIFETIAI